MQRDIRTSRCGRFDSFLNGPVVTLLETENSIFAVLGRFLVAFVAELTLQEMERFDRTNCRILENRGASGHSAFEKCDETGAHRSARGGAWRWGNRLACSVSWADSVLAALVVVEPAVPNRIVVAIVAELTLYRIGEWMGGLPNSGRIRC